MKEEEYEDRVKKLQDVNGVITKLDPAIREHAFKLLEAYITGRKSKQTGEEKDDSNVDNDDGMEAFFSKFDHEKPSDNALSIAAYHYSQYGKEPVSYDEVRQIASDVGLTIPERVDMTYKSAKEKGKSLFR